MNELGKFERVELKDYWKHEASDFTPWLADNMELLSDALDIDLDLEGTEVPIGIYKADIIAKDINTGGTVVIENQLDKSDHAHLGKMLTYAAGKDAFAVVWVCRNITDEHRRAIDWLNKSTQQGVNFFALEIELWKIDNSLPAPKFNMVCKPNEWPPPDGISPPQTLQKQFWEGLRDYMQEAGTFLKLKKPAPLSWYNIGIGRAGFVMGLGVYTKRKQISCELYITHEKAKRAFELLENQKSGIEEKIGGELEWMKLEEKKASRIVQRKDGNFQNKSEWQDLFKWLKEKAEKFHTAFSDRVKNLELDEM